MPGDHGGEEIFHQEGGSVDGNDGPSDGEHDGHDDGEHDGHDDGEHDGPSEGVHGGPGEQQSTPPEQQSTPPEQQSTPPEQQSTPSTNAGTSALPPQAVGSIAMPDGSPGVLFSDGHQESLAAMAAAGVTSSGLGVRSEDGLSEDDDTPEEAAAGRERAREAMREEQRDRIVIDNPEETVNYDNTANVQETTLYEQRPIP